MPTEMPRGYFKAVRFPVLAMLDTWTGDGRRLRSQGASTRELPLSIRAQFTDSYGHQGAEVSGALFEVTIDPEAGVMAGRGFLLDDPNGRRHARMIATKAMRGNSVDLADIEVEVDFDEDWNILIDFTRFSIAATTGVATPAFAQAYAEIDEMADEDLVASLGDPMAELVVEAPWSLNFGTAPMDLVASGAPLPSWGDFHIPEADVPTKITPDADGRVWGHLATWDSCHDSHVNYCIQVPRPMDNYASFNKPGVLTDRGMVETGPIFARGGHRPSGGADDLEKAYGGIENAWADVRVIPGRLGPWVSGRVRPGVDDATIYAVRASRVSGHWVKGRLKAIVSVNAEGFDVAGSGLSASPFAFSADDSGVVELVASLVEPCADATDDAPVEAAEPEAEPTTDDGSDDATGESDAPDVDEVDDPEELSAEELAEDAADDDLLLELLIGDDAM